MQGTSSFPGNCSEAVGKIMEVWEEQGMEINKPEYENHREIKSNEIQKCQESTTLHFPNYVSVGQSRKERLQMFNQL